MVSSIMDNAIVVLNVVSPYLDDIERIHGKWLTEQLLDRVHG